MFSFFKRKSAEVSTEAPVEVQPIEVSSVALEPSTLPTELPPASPPTDQPTVPLPTIEDTPSASALDKTEAVEKVEKKGFFGRLWQQLSRTRERLGDNLKSLLTGRKVLDNDTRDELETLLLTADIGLATTDVLLDRLSQVRLKEHQDLMQALAEIMEAMLTETQQKPEIFPPAGNPRVILMVGVNGVGKTTTIAKLSHHFLQDGKKLLLAAGDTFRAAAVEQIKTWGERHQVAVITQGQGADAASVLHDAFSAAKARGVDVLIGDTAGRLHTQQHLMEELKKIRRVLARLDAQAPHETWLVVDATTGQNAVNQAIAFHQAIGLTGIVLTKLDGTAKGGIVFSLVEQLGIPIRYIGIGESAEDLRPFDASAFVRALLGVQSVVAES